LTKLKKKFPKNGLREEGKVEVLLKESGIKSPIESCSLKLFYNYFRSRVFVHPIANSFWTRLFPGTEEENIWENLRIKYMDPMVKNFNFLLRHYVIYTKMRL